jgi:[histone H3]-lysine36 N-dimethyltransferase SETMAR
MKNHHIRFYIYIRYKLGLKADAIYHELNSAIPVRPPSKATVYRWFAYFRNKGKLFEDLPRSGRPITETNFANVQRVRSFIEEDPWCTYDDIEEESSLSRGTILRIIHDHLKLHKVTSRWVPYQLSEQNKADRVRICRDNLAKFEDEKWRLCDVVTGDEVWIYFKQSGRKQSNKSWVAKGEKSRKVVKPSRYLPKAMFTLFFKTTGVVHLSYLEKGKTINHNTYINNCLKPLVDTLNRERPVTGTKNMKFHHDNARPHVHSSVTRFLEREQFIIMGHPPYSPDLAPSDFWLNDYIKQRLGDHSSVESLNRQITEIVSDIPRSEYLKTFEKWIERIKLCIKYKGDYFEHL